MRYVAECIMDGVQHRSLHWDSHLYKAKLLIRDSDFDEVEYVDKVPKTGVLGCYAQERTHVVTCMDAYQVKFFEYVKVVRTYINVLDTPLCDCNILTGDRFDAFESIMYSQDKQTLVVTFESGVCKLAGESGSVALLTYNSIIGSFMSLYDMFFRLCKRTGICVMSYKTVQLYGLRGDTVVVLELSQSQEALRYFTKMYMDVMRP